MRKLLMKLFKLVNVVAVFVFLVSACAVDSDSWMPAIICASALAYLGCALYINEAIQAKKHKRMCK